MQARMSADRPSTYCLFPVDQSWCDAWWHVKCFFLFFYFFIRKAFSFKCCNAVRLLRNNFHIDWLISNGFEFAFVRLPFSGPCLEGKDKKYMSPRTQLWANFFHFQSYSWGSELKKKKKKKKKALLSIMSAQWSETFLQKLKFLFAVQATDGHEKWTTKISAERRVLLLT